MDRKKSWVKRDWVPHWSWQALHVRYWDSYRDHVQYHRSRKRCDLWLRPADAAMKTICFMFRWVLMRDDNKERRCTSSTTSV